MIRDTYVGNSLLTHHASLIIPNYLIENIPDCPNIEESAESVTRTIVALDFGFFAFTWKLPADWTRVETASLADVTVESVTKAGTGAIKDGALTLSLRAGQAVLITPR